MANAKISDLTPVPQPMSGTELLEIEKAGTSYKVQAGDLAVCPPAAAQITTSAVSQDLDPLCLYYEITTGGTGGDELLNLPTPPLDDNFQNVQFCGRTMLLTVKTQTDPGDRVVITANGGGSIPYLFPANFSALSYTAAASGGAVLDFSGAAIAFVWVLGQWVLSNQLTNQNDSTTVQVANSYVTGAPDFDLSGKAATASEAGGNVTVSGGDSSHAGKDAGNLTLKAGVSTNTGLQGKLLMPDLPTVDPLFAGELWNDGGTPRISAG